MRHKRWANTTHLDHNNMWYAAASAAGKGSLTLSHTCSVTSKWDAKQVKFLSNASPHHQYRDNVKMREKRTRTP